MNDAVRRSVHTLAVLTAPVPPLSSLTGHETLHSGLESDRLLCGQRLDVAHARSEPLAHLGTRGDGTTCDTITDSNYMGRGNVVTVTMWDG